MSSCGKLSKGWERNGVQFRVPLAAGLVRGCFLRSLRYGGLNHEHFSPAAQCGNRIQHLKRKRLRRASQSSTLMSKESIHPPPTFPLASHSPNASYIPGPPNSDQTLFGLVAEPMQTGFWSQVPSQQTWELTPPTQLTPSIQDDFDLRAWPIDSHGNNILSYSEISGPLNTVPIVSSVTGAVFTMTCPVPHCYFQCQTIVDMWKHITWTHLQYVVERAKY